MFQPEEAVEIKGGAHAALGLLAGLCCGYNLAAWTERHETHLAVNSLIYGLLLWWEYRQMRHHWSAGQ